MKERIQKIIAASGYSSRREAEKLISDGIVTVNGFTASIGDKADAETDRILIAGKPLNRYIENLYYILNKPAGYVTTLHDEKGRKSISSLIGSIPGRVYPVGRLDMFSEGLLILTNDGELSNALMHPKKEIEKKYLLTVNYSAGCNIRDAAVELRKPIEIDGKVTAPAKVEIISNSCEMNVSDLLVTIHEGRNRQIRRLCERSGLKVKRLCRISEGPIELGNLPCGKCRKLSETEVMLIRKAVCLDNG